MRPARRAVAVALLAATAAAVPPAASAQVADLDAASDVLLLRDVYYPYRPPVPQAQRRQLDAVVGELGKVGIPLKVAVIAGPSDLGNLRPALRSPAAYADYLAGNLGEDPQRIVVTVMRSGVAESGASPAQARALTSVRPPADGGPRELTHTALRAVTRLADASGHPVRTSVRADGGDEPASSGGDGGSGAVLALVPLALGAALATVLVVRRRLGGRRR